MILEPQRTQAYSTSSQPVNDETFTCLVLLLLLLVHYLNRRSLEALANFLLRNRHLDQTGNWRRFGDMFFTLEIRKWNWYTLDMTSVTYMLESPWLVAYNKSTAIAVTQMGSWEWVHYYINPLICIQYTYTYILYCFFNYICHCFKCAITFHYVLFLLIIDSCGPLINEHMYVYIYISLFMISFEGVWPSVLHKEISLEPAEAVV